MSESAREKIKWLHYRARHALGQNDRDVATDALRDEAQWFVKRNVWLNQENDRLLAENKRLTDALNMADAANVYFEEENEKLRQFAAKNASKVEALVEENEGLAEELRKFRMPDSPSMEALNDR